MASLTPTTSPSDFPREKLDAQLNEIENKDDYAFVALLTTGSLNPIHNGHLESFEAAKTALESQLCKTARKPFKVVGGFISPSDRGWCERKQYGALSNAYRLALTQKACSDSEWIEASNWEIDQDSMIDFPEVMVHFQQWLKDTYDSICPIRAYYLCGADHAKKCRLLIGRSQYGVCAMSRPGYNLPNIRTKKEVVIVEVDGVDLSSTQIRQALMSKKLSEHSSNLHPKVYKSLQKFQKCHEPLSNFTKINDSGDEEYFADDDD